MSGIFVFVIVLALAVLSLYPFKPRKDGRLGLQYYLPFVLVFFYLIYEAFIPDAWNIRVDLLLIDPVMSFVCLVGTIRWLILTVRIARNVYVPPGVDSPLIKSVVMLILISVLTVMFLRTPYVLIMQAVHHTLVSERTDVENMFGEMAGGEHSNKYKYTARSHRIVELGRKSPREVIPILQSIALDTTIPHHCLSYRLLGRLHDSTTIPFLIHALDSPDSVARIYAVQAISGLRLLGETHFSLYGRIKEKDIARYRRWWVEHRNEFGAQ